MARAYNASLEYTASNKTQRFSFYVEGFSQPFNLSGASHQSRLSRQFYPRSFVPGDMTVNARVVSQEQLQRLARFIRGHHLALINTPSSMMFNRLDLNSPGYKRLMKLTIVGEGIVYRGFIPSFQITKKGVFDPAPAFSFPFTVIYDPHSTNIRISGAIKKTDEDKITKVAVVEGPAGANEDDNPKIDINVITGTGVPGTVKDPREVPE